MHQADRERGARRAYAGVVAVAMCDRMRMSARVVDVRLAEGGLQLLNLSEQFALTGIVDPASTALGGKRLMTVLVSDANTVTALRFTAGERPRGGGNRVPHRLLL